MAGLASRRLSANGFTACHAAGVRKSAHGLRKAAATHDAQIGFSESELEAKYGWRGGRMASHYTRAMNRERLAINAAERTRNNSPQKNDA